MKKNLCTLFCVSFIFSTFFYNTVFGQPERVFQEQLRLVKEKYNFANWGIDTGKVISGMPITAQILPQLSEMDKVWRKDNYSVQNIQKITYVKIRKLWRSENGEFEATMVLGSTFEAVKQYLIMRYAETQREPPLIKPAGRKFDLKIGNVSFVTAIDRRGEAFSSIDFIRHNVLIMVRAEGDVRKELKAMAETLDTFLLEKKPVAKYKQLPDLPTIKTFSLEKSKIKLRESVMLTVEVNNPGKRELHYFWTMTGGGVEKDLLENFVYYGTEAGIQHITVTVVNDIGLYGTESVDIEVVKP